MKATIFLFLSIFLIQVPTHGCNVLTKTDGEHEKEDVGLSLYRKDDISDCQGGCYCMDYTGYYCCSREDVCEEELHPNAEPFYVCGNCLALCFPGQTKHCCCSASTTESTTTTTTTAAPSGGGGCFPATARVSLENGKQKSMSQLQIGNRVQTVCTEGSLTYNKVRGFLEKRHSSLTKYRTIITGANNTVSLTGNHLIYARKYCGGKFVPLYADQVIIGDEVLVQGYDHLNPSKVVNVSSVMMQGSYIPLIMEGKLIVDGVLASCYPAIDQDMIHFVMTPIQMFPGRIEWIFGDDEGLLTFVNILGHVGRPILPHGNVYEIFN